MGSGSGQSHEQGSSGCPLCIMLQQNITVCLLLGMVVLSGVIAGAALPDLVAGLSTFMHTAWQPSRSAAGRQLARNLNLASRCTAWAY